MDAAGAGSTISCPTCEAEITIPQIDITNIHTAPPSKTSAAAKEEKHFQVPVHDKPAEILVKKKVKDEDEDSPPAGAKRIKVKTIRRGDCLEVGVDMYDKTVAAFLNKIGEENIINLSNVAYTHVDLGTEKILEDYGIQIIYRA